MNQTLIERYNSLQKFIVTSLIFNMSLALSQERIELKLEPKQCVSLREGQKCYAVVKINWNAQNAGEYCLYSSVQDKALQCWHNESSGHYESKLTITRDLIFTIKSGIDSSIKASAGMELAWVYKKNSRPRSSWRMF